MDFRLVFEPVQKPEGEGIPSASVYESIYVNETKMPNWRKARVAFFTIGSEDKNFANPVREAFYSLYKGYSSDYIVDLGILKAGIDLEETHGRIKEVCTELLLANTIPLIIGSHHAQDYGQYMGFEELGKDVNLLVADAKIDLLDSHDEAESHGKSIVLHTPNYLFNYTHIGFQSYLNAPEVFETLEKLNFDGIRIGEINGPDGMKKVEPYIRFANMLSFDLSVVRHSDGPGKADTFPFGMTAEQFCQMCWYAGISNSCKSVGIYGYDAALDDRNVTAKMVAVAIWYLVEGISEREEQHDFESDYFKKFIVSVSDFPDMVFYKSRLKEFWWVKVEDKIFPCAYADYEMASSGEAPEIYTRFLMKNT